MPQIPLASTFDFSRCILTVGGIPISGFGEGDGVFEMEMKEDDWEVTTGADGLSQWVKKGGVGGVAEGKIKLLHTAISNAALAIKAKLDNLSGKGAVPLSYFDPSTGTTVGVAQMRVKKVPKVSSGVKPADPEWPLICVGTVITHGGAIPTIAG